MSSFGGATIPKKPSKTNL